MGNVSFSVLNNFYVSCDFLNFYFENMFKGGYDKIWSIIKYILILSHGQPSIKKRLFYEKNMKVENLTE